MAEGEPVDVLTTQNLRSAFEVETAVQVDPVTGSPQVWLIGPAESSFASKGEAA